MSRRRRRENEPEAFLGTGLALFLLVERLGAKCLIALAMIFASEGLFGCQRKGKK